MTEFVKDGKEESLDDIRDDDHFALQLADTIKRGCESNSEIVVEILPSANGYAMAVYASKWSCEVFVKPVAHTHTLN
jgi:hypothetical protein